MKTPRTEAVMRHREVYRRNGNEAEMAWQHATKLEAELIAASEELDSIRAIFHCRASSCPLLRDLEVFQHELVPMFTALAETVDPRMFQTFLGSLLANVVGNLSDEYWEQVRQTGPCAILGCDCHAQAETVMKALDKLRDDHKKVMDERDQ